VRKLPLRGRSQAEGGEKISDFQVCSRISLGLLSLSVEGDRAPAPLFFLALYRLQNAKHFICCIISSYFSRLPPLRTRTSRSEGDYNLEQNPPIPPLNRGWSRAKAKTRHFPLLDLGVEGEEYNFPIHYAQDRRLVKDDTKSLWFSYVKGSTTTRINITLLQFFFLQTYIWWCTKTGCWVKSNKC